MIALLLGLIALCLITNYLATELLISLPDIGLSALGRLLQQGFFLLALLFILWCFAEE
ncbi:hypothetical protein NIES970_13240 [[Synechococcus] sp. NIES-970]|nr:hypothetical protein NIES970_13240 [[Synechococcus] sp. NIES-970]